MSAVNQLLQCRLAIVRCHPILCDGLKTIFALLQLLVTCVDVLLCNIIRQHLAAPVRTIDLDRLADLQVSHHLAVWHELIASADNSRQAEKFLRRGIGYELWLFHAAHPANSDHHRAVLAVSNCASAV